MVWVSFAWITLLHGGKQRLLRCKGSPSCFSSGFRGHLHWRYWLANQVQQHHGHWSSFCSNAAFISSVHLDTRVLDGSRSTFSGRCHCLSAGQLLSLQFSPWLSQPWQPLAISYPSLLVLCNVPIYWKQNFWFSFIIINTKLLKSNTNISHPNKLYIIIYSITEGISFWIFSNIVRRSCKFWSEINPLSPTFWVSLRVCLLSFWNGWFFPRYCGFVPQWGQIKVREPVCLLTLLDRTQFFDRNLITTVYLQNWSIIH